MSGGINSSGKTLPFGKGINEVTIGKDKFLELEDNGVNGTEKGIKVKVDGVLLVMQDSIGGTAEEFLQVVIDGQVQYLDTSLQIVSKDIHSLLDAALNAGN